MTEQREERKKTPLRHGDLHDPQLPVIHGDRPRKQSLQQIHPAPIPQSPLDC